MRFGFGPHTVREFGNFDDMGGGIFFWNQRAIPGPPPTLPALIDFGRSEGIMVFTVVGMSILLAS